MLDSDLQGPVSTRLNKTLGTLFRSSAVMCTKRPIEGCNANHIKRLAAGAVACRIQQA